MKRINTSRPCDEREVYGYFYQCTNCEKDNIFIYDKYCCDCGVKLQWTKKEEEKIIEYIKYKGKIKPFNEDAFIKMLLGKITYK